MPHIRFLFISALLLTIIACAPLAARYDFDAEADFSQYQNYQWQNRSHKANAITDNSLLEKRIQSIANEQLSFQNLNLVESNPDFYLTYHISTRERIDVRDYGYGYWRPYRYGPSTDVYQYTEGTLIIDMIDAKNNKLVWRGWTSRVVNQPSISEALLEKALGEIFKNFPL
jgi:hypothetical protein